MRRLPKLLGGTLTVVVMLSVPLFALGLIASWAYGWSAEENRPVIAASDDAVANGLRIVTPPEAGPRPTSAPAGNTEAETLLRDWQFTRTPPSQGS
jgi:hypothetical protein